MTEARDTPKPVPARIEAMRLDPGLYLVATPIGAARDITLRALDVLNSADLLAAEDTRVLRHLMEIHGLALRGRRIMAIHDHNEEKQAQALSAAIVAGQSVAYCSDAGTPLVADPGFRLARAVARAGLAIRAVPGASAALAALSVAGLPSDRFLFAGFAPQPVSARRSWLHEVTSVDATAIIFDSPRRVKQTLGILCEIDPNRSMVLCRELTKKFEETMRGTAADIAGLIPDGGLKGEIVLVIDRPAEAAPSEGDIDTALMALLGEKSVRDAAAVVADRFGIARRDAYQRALALERKG